MGQTPWAALGAANENAQETGAARRTASPSATLPGEEFSCADRTGLAMLRSGRSFAEAATSSGVAVSRLLTLWRTQQQP